MAMNISCKFEKASCNIFLVRAVTVNTLRRRRRNEVKSIVSTGCYPVDTNIAGNPTDFCLLMFFFFQFCIFYLKILEVSSTDFCLPTFFSNSHNLF